MIYRALGRTGMKVSAISMGCAAIGRDYCGPGVYGKSAERLLEYAVKVGINAFDTDPGYGQSEGIVGALASEAFVWTKGARDAQDSKEIHTVGHPELPIGLSVYFAAGPLRPAAFYQYPYNLLDRRGTALCSGYPGTIARSILLRGKLASMAEEAIRWALFSGPDTCLIGFRSEREIDFALRCLEKGPIDYEAIIDPRTWT